MCRTFTLKASQSINKKKCMYSLVNVVRSKYISGKAKVQIYKIVTRPIVMYGSEYYKNAYGCFFLDEEVSLLNIDNIDGKLHEYTRYWFPVFHPAR